MYIQMDKCLNGHLTPRALGVLKSLGMVKNVPLWKETCHLTDS